MSFKIKVPKALAEKYGLERGSTTKAIVDLIEEKLAEARKLATDTVDHIVGLGLKSNHPWNGEDLVEALTRAR
jgi:bifunctional DNA-binding transcriptional regulator/antitoxin component of YhaV-PrlF toxin-antitoxin module